MKRTFVPPSGDKNAKLGACGEQPGIEEVRGRPPRPFIGPAGRAQDECMIMAKIPRSSVYFTNVIKDLDKPLAAYIDLRSNGKYTISNVFYPVIVQISVL